MSDTDVISMPGVGFIGMILIGFLAGYIAERTMQRRHGIVTNILVGIAGSFVGAALAKVFDVQFYGFAGNLIVATLGAVVVLWVFGRVQSTRPNETGR